MKGKIIAKSMVIWLGILPLAILNGALREFALVPLFGAVGFVLSGMLLGGMIYIMLSVFLPRLGKGTPQTYRRMGLLWVFCTVAFETLLGLLGGEPLADIAAAYDMTTGNLWLLVVVFIGFAPWLVAKRKKMI